LTNRTGFHCGACHDGEKKVGGRTIFAACGEKPAQGPAPPACGRCHARSAEGARRKEYEAFAAKMPRRGLDDAVDWEAAEAKGLIRPADQVEGVSVTRPALRLDKDVTLAGSAWMSDVRFSHTKHAVWNGCEVCHPDIYPHRDGGDRSSMLQISAGESCGVCHDRVAFSLGDCERCHVKPVR
jgi:c(7)-type cytochrome triheme protein